MYRNIQKRFSFKLKQQNPNDYVRSKQQDTLKSNSLRIQENFCDPQDILFISKPGFEDIFIRPKNPYVSLSNKSTAIQQNNNTIVEKDALEQAIQEFDQVLENFSDNTNATDALGASVMVQTDIVV